MCAVPLDQLRSKRNDLRVIVEHDIGSHLVGIQKLGFLALQM